MSWGIYGASSQVGSKTKRQIIAYNMTKSEIDCKRIKQGVISYTGEEGEPSRGK